MYRMCLLLASVSLVDINECGLVGPDYNILSLLYVTIIITVLINARGVYQLVLSLCLYSCSYSMHSELYR